MPDQSDLRLEELLRAALRADVETLEVRVRPEDVQRRAQERRARAHRAGRYGTRPRLLVVAAALLIPLAALYAVAQRPVDPGSDGWQAVLVRGLDGTTGGSGTPDLEVVLAAANGSVRSLTRIPASRFPEGMYLGRALVSPTGWLYISGGLRRNADEGSFLIDLIAADHTIREVEAMGGTDGIGAVAWGPDGMFWHGIAGGVERLDPVTGDTSRVFLTQAETFEPVTRDIALTPTADGSGLIMGPTFEIREAALGQPPPYAFGTLAMDGTLAPGIAAAADGPAARLLDRAGGQLYVCDASRSVGSAPCAGKPTGSIMSGPDADGRYIPWGGPPQPDHFVLDASWAADAGVWLLLDRRDGGRQFVLVHRDTDGNDTEAATFAADPEGSVTFWGIAPDDSLFAINYIENSWGTALADTATGRAYLHPGLTAGYVWPGVARAWPHDEFTGQPGNLLPATPPPDSVGYPPLPTLEEQTLGMERILLVHEEPGASGPDPVEVRLGPVEIEEGYAVSLLCSGPGDVWFEEYTAGVPEPSSTVVRCQDGFGYDAGAPDVTGESPSFVVTGEPGTAWRLVIHDPPPSDRELDQGGYHPELGVRASDP